MFQHLIHAQLSFIRFAIHSLGLVLGMCPAHLQAFRDRHFSSPEQRNLIVKYDDTLQLASDRVKPLGNPGQNQQLSTHHQSHTMRAILDGDLRKDVVSACGIILPRHVSDSEIQVHY